ncbi:hypothetical protein MBLNU459_g4727t1 [Dothideomycetes sp. NU459]
MEQDGIYNPFPGYALPSTPNRKITSLPVQANGRGIDTADIPMVDSPISTRLTGQRTSRNVESRASKARETYAQRKTLKCGFCDQFHSCQFNLKQHERTHTKETPFACEICSRRFTRRWLRSRHMKSKHRNIAKSQARTKSEPVTTGDDVEMETPDYDDVEWVPDRQTAASAPSGIISAYTAAITDADAEFTTAATPITAPAQLHDPFAASSNFFGDSLQVSYPNNGLGSINWAADPTKWPTLFAVPTQSPGAPIDIIVCAECNFTGNYASALQLQEHRHEVHQVPYSALCTCRSCNLWGQLRPAAAGPGDAETAAAAAAATVLQTETLLDEEDAVVDYGAFLINPDAFKLP